MAQKSAESTGKFVTVGEVVTDILDGRLPFQISEKGKLSPISLDIVSAIDRLGKGWRLEPSLRPRMTNKLEAMVDSLQGHIKRRAKPDYPTMENTFCILPGASLNSKGFEAWFFEVKNWKPELTQPHRQSLLPPEQAYLNIKLVSHIPGNLSEYKHLKEEAARVEKVYVADRRMQFINALAYEVICRSENLELWGKLRPTGTKLIL